MGVMWTLRWKALTERARVERGNCCRRMEELNPRHEQCSLNIHLMAPQLGCQNLLNQLQVQSAHAVAHCRAWACMDTALQNISLFCTPPTREPDLLFQAMQDHGGEGDVFKQIRNPGSADDYARAADYPFIAEPLNTFTPSCRVLQVRTETSLVAGTRMCLSTPV